MSGVSGAILTKDDMREDLAVVVDLVRRCWSYYESRVSEHGFCLDELAARYSSEIDDTPLEHDAFVLLLERFVASLNDSHALIAPAQDRGDQRSLPFVLLNTQDGPAVQRLSEEAEVLGITLGDVLVTIDGTPVEAVLDRVAQHLSASTPNARRAASIRQLHGWLVRLPEYAGKPSLALGVRKADGSLGEVSVDWFRSWRYRDEPAWSEPYQLGATWERRSDGVGLLRIATCGAPGDLDEFVRRTKDRIARAFDELSGMTHLAIDLRANPGGSDDILMHAAAHLVPVPFTYYTLKTRYSRELSRIRNVPCEGWGDADDCVVRAPIVRPVFDGPVALLVDEITGSAAGNFCYFLKEMRPGTTLIGQPFHATIGACTSLAKLPHTGAEVYLPVMIGRSPKGAIIEGKSLPIDEIVAWSAADLRSGRDPHWRRALEIWGG